MGIAIGNNWTMTLSGLLAAPLNYGYNRSGNRGQRSVVELGNAHRLIQTLVPPGYRVRRSGMAVNLPTIPWLAILDSDQTNTAMEGIYVVYLYSADSTRLYLSLNQGVTAHEKRAKNTPTSLRAGKNQHQRAIDSIKRDTEVLRHELRPLMFSHPSAVAEIDLGSSNELAEGYEAGHMVGFAYQTATMPNDRQLIADLNAMLALYTTACEVADKHALLNPANWTTASGDAKQKTTNSLRTKAQYDGFVPRESSDLSIPPPPFSPTPRTRTRKHEALLTEFALRAKSSGFRLTNTEIGMRDLLMLAPDGTEFLVEAKTVTGDGQSATRDAIGQLFAYRHVYYSLSTRPTMVALLNLPVADTWLELLADLSIEVIHRDADTWVFSRNIRPYF